MDGNTIRNPALWAGQSMQMTGNIHLEERGVSTLVQLNVYHTSPPELNARIIDEMRATMERLGVTLVPAK